MGVQKYTSGLNWVSNSFSSHCIIHKNMDFRVSKISNRVSKRHPDTPLAKGLTCIDLQFKKYSAHMNLTLGRGNYMHRKALINIQCSLLRWAFNTFQAHVGQLNTALFTCIQGDVLSVIEVRNRLSAVVQFSQICRAYIWHKDSTASHTSRPRPISWPAV